MKPRAVLVLILVASCRKPAPEAPLAAPAPPPVEVEKNGRWLFTYVEPDGKFGTTDKPDAIPERSRQVVRVVDPSISPGKRLDTTDVYVVDVNQLLKSGKVQAKTLPRDAFESAAIAQLPPGRSSLRTARPAVPPEPEIPAARGDAGMPAGPPVVVVYGTSWCAACREARRYLTEHRIPFADKDIEKDPAAARELGEKAARLGIPADRVPVLDVRGRLLVGFDEKRVEALLGQPA